MTDTIELIDKADSTRIAAELTEAADALEAGRHSGGSEGLHETGFHAWAETQGFTGTEVHAAADAWLEAWNRAAPAAQVAQEGGGVSASAYLAKVEADPRRAAALQRARDRTPGVATRHPRCGYPYCACVGQCFAASQPGAADGVKGRR